MMLLVVAGCVTERPAEVTTLPSATQSPTATGNVDTPPPTSTATERPKRDWNITDNGIDGIGTMRGNTNGNLYLDGRAVDAGSIIYYVDYIELCILSYDKESESESIIYETSDESKQTIRCLNWYADVLYFAIGNAVYAYSPVNGQVVRIHEEYSDAPYVYNLHVAYDLLFIGYSRNDTICLNASTYEFMYRYEGYYVESIMDGRLYGYYHADEKYTSMHPDGTEEREYPPFQIAADGKLYYLDEEWADLPADFDPSIPDDFGNTWDMSQYFMQWKYPAAAKLHITDIASGETKVRYITEIPCAPFMNIWHDKIYLQLSGHDYCGKPFLMNMDWEWLGQVHNYDFAMGITLIDGRPAYEFGVYCDP